MIPALFIFQASLAQTHSRAATVFVDELDAGSFQCPPQFHTSIIGYMDPEIGLHPLDGRQGKAGKAAETDATKRALATFGKPFGLELYRGGKIHQKPLPALPAIPVPADARVGFHPDETTPIPRPSAYYGRRHRPSAAEHRRDARRNAEQQSPTAAPPPAPASPNNPSPARIDKSQLALPEPRRLRNKAHLKFVASQPCLVCGRQPCDPHHLRFAQPRAIGMKVNDEFTVPLCRDHHRQLHQAGNEVAWWKDLNIEAHEIAKGIWDQTHPKPRATEVTETRQPD